MHPMNHTTTRLSPAINSVTMKLLALRYAATLALSLLLGCETVRPEQELLDLGRAALDGGDFTTAVERYTLAIETAARSKPASRCFAASREVASTAHTR